MKTGLNMISSEYTHDFRVTLCPVHASCTLSAGTWFYQIKGNLFFLNRVILFLCFKNSRSDISYYVKNFFENFCKIHRKTPAVKLFFCTSWTKTLVKSRLHGRYFLENLANVLKAPVSCFSEQPWATASLGSLCYFT